ncbi:MAG: amidohydrolase [Gammaproteobacteria bacterium]|jgi:L-fuconolactonase|nr:amidohydrolase [Gammaproteobacteria bacterium]|tara:strand:+ start:485 stop:1492 length:1008 start_codon:yes stop_codon:yes gene_type:complete
MNSPTPGSQAWLDLVDEPIIDPTRPIVDPHHHLWDRPNSTYALAELWADTDSGHNIKKTVFLECSASYREVGPAHLRPVGETEFVQRLAAASSEGRADQAQIAGIVGAADLSNPDLDEILDAHEDAGQGLFRGIRHSGARDPYPEVLRIPGRAPAGLYQSDAFRVGVARLGERGLTYDTWHYHHQNGDFADLAAAVPGTTMILDHFGTPLGVGPYAGQREVIFSQWQDDIARIAECGNVVAKLGGLAMPDNGFGWHEESKPPTSDELIEAQSRYYHHTIACFGAERCMFESNFPVDRWSLSYPVLWNAFKKMAARYSALDQGALFCGTATRVYRL